MRIMLALNKFFLIFIFISLFTNCEEKLVCNKEINFNELDKSIMFLDNFYYKNKRLPSNKEFEKFKDPVYKNKYLKYHPIYENKSSIYPIEYVLTSFSFTFKGKITLSNKFDYLINFETLCSIELDKLDKLDKAKNIIYYHNTLIEHIKDKPKFSFDYFKKMKLENKESISVYAKVTNISYENNKFEINTKEGIYKGVFYSDKVKNFIINNYINKDLTIIGTNSITGVFQNCILYQKTNIDGYYYDELLHNVEKLDVKFCNVN